MKGVWVILASVLAFILLLHIESILAQTNPPDVNVGVPEPKVGGRKCFVCNSFYSPKCADWFDNSTWNIQPCGANYTLCRKMIQEAYYDGTWNVRYVRQCALTGEVGADEGRRCIERAGMYRVKMRYCHCDNKDGCNGAASVTPNYSMILPLLVGLFIYKYIHKLL